jgi:acyl dehydratase
LGEPPLTAETALELASLPDLVGRELGPTPWLEVTQERVDAFARSADDTQWIHTDRRRAAAGPFGTTIAHGFLTLALAVRFWDELVRLEDVRLTVNYGLNRVRFPAAVPTGSRIRGRLRVHEVAEIEAGAQATIGVTIELEGATKPACVAELVLRFPTVGLAGGAGRSRPRARCARRRRPPGCHLGR